MGINSIAKKMAIFDEKIEIRERCKGVHCVDLGESFPTRIYLQKSASIQPRTSPSKFGGKFNSLFTSLAAPPAVAVPGDIHQDRSRSPRGRVAPKPVSVAPQPPKPASPRKRNEGERTGPCMFRQS